MHFSRIRVLYVMKELLHLALDFYRSICPQKLPSFDLQDSLLFSSYYHGVQSAERCDHVVQKRMVRYLVRGDKRLFGVENMSLFHFLFQNQ